MKAGKRSVVVVLAVLAAAGIATGVLLGLESGSAGLSRDAAERAVALVRRSNVGPDPLLLPRRIGIYRDVVLREGPRNLMPMRVRSEARRVPGGIEVTLRMREQDFEPYVHWWRWRVVGSHKVVYEGDGGRLAVDMN